MNHPWSQGVWIKEVPLYMCTLVHKRMLIYTFKGLSATFEASNECFLHLRTFVKDIHC